jgi:hypothetical protein
MREQSDQQNKKFREIKERTAAIRKRYEEQQRRSIVGMHELHIQSPRSYAHGLINFIISNYTTLYVICIMQSIIHFHLLLIFTFLKSGKHNIV